MRQNQNNAQIQDLLRNSNFNRIPTIKLDIHQAEGQEIAVLTIKNRPDKPFFLTEDKEYQGEKIRAGVVYSRLGDTNIPLISTTPEDKIELMWRERFGFGLDPLSRLTKLLDEDLSNWVKIESESYIYHRQFPEFTIVDGENINARYEEPWTRNFPDHTAWSYYVEVRYLTTILKKVLFVACDGGRYKIPAPKRVNDSDRWTINLDELGYKISKLYEQYFPLEMSLHGFGIDIIPPPQVEL